MPTLADSLLSSSARPLGLRMRPDLVARQQRYQGKLYWVLKDPIGLNYFRFQEEEYALLQMLDGLASLDDLKRQFEKQFAPEQISLDELGQFVGMLHRSGLVIADMAGQGQQLFKRSGERWWQEFWAAAGNVLAIRFKGIDPERVLNWLDPKMKWFFNRRAVIFFSLVILTALCWVLVQFDVFYAKLPEFHVFFAKGNWFWLGLVLCVTKICHEFGHGLSCKRCGGECHELGFMLLVLTPCLYCNVSDSWMLRNKWYRAAIGAAGMYVELVIASIATFVWWFSEPGLANQLALNTMFVCSVSTVVFNGNPLLRYDGYYILADLSEIPNLRQKATTILSRKAGAWFLGLEEPEDPFLPQRNQLFFALYSVASAVYGWIVMFSILWFLYKVFEPYGLEIIGQLIGAAAIAGLVVRPLWQLWKFFRVPGRMEQVDKTRFRLSVAGAVALLMMAVWVPLPYRVLCTAEIEARDAQNVYIKAPGRLLQVFVYPGKPVKKGDLLAILGNDDLQIAIAELKAQQADFAVQLENKLYEGHHNEQAESQIPQIEAKLAAIDEELAKKELDVRYLSLYADVDGYVIPPPPAPPPPADADNQRLPTYSGTPLDPKNLGATLKPGTLFCQVGDPTKMQASLVIDQADLDLVGKGQPVVVKIDELPGDNFLSQITKVAPQEMKVADKEVSHTHGGDLQTKTDSSGVERPMTPSYQALAELDDQEQILRVGLRGRAKVTSTQWLSLGRRAWRAFNQTFHFKL